MDSAGFELSPIYVGSWVTGIHSHWRKYSDKVLKEVDIIYEHGDLTIIILEKGDDTGVAIALKLEWSPNEKDISSSSRVIAEDIASPYTKDEYGAKYNCAKALELAQVMYIALSPEFGWIEICKSSGYTRSEDVVLAKITHVYWGNFFGPKYVEKYGEDFFIKAPGWKAEPLTDGGYLYVLAPIMKKSPKAFLKEITEYFGIEFARKKPKTKNPKRSK